MTVGVSVDADVVAVDADTALVVAVDAAGAVGADVVALDAVALDAMALDDVVTVADVVALEVIDVVAVVQGGTVGGLGVAAWPAHANPSAYRESGIVLV